HGHAEVDRLFAIALPVSMFDVSPIAGSAKPKLFLAGDRDPYCPYTALEAVVSGLAGENVLHRLGGADHFLSGFEEEVGEAVSRFCAHAGQPASAVHASPDPPCQDRRRVPMSAPSRPASGFS